MVNIFSYGRYEKRKKYIIFFIFEFIKMTVLVILLDLKDIMVKISHFVKNVTLPPIELVSYYW